MVPSETSTARRRFLKLLATSPLLSCTGLPSGWMQALAAGQDRSGISSVQEALNVMDFEPAARKNLLPEHWAYLATGVDDDSTLRANREGFTRYQLRMRPLADISRLDMSIQLFGVRWNTPIVLCPVASLKGFHTEGEKGVARAARSKGHLQMLSTVTSTSVEEVNAARGEPVWYQLYARDQWSETLKLVKRVETAGCPALVWTVDLLGGSNRETFRRAQPPEGVRAPLCKNCHEGLRKPMYEGLAEQAGGEGSARAVYTWDGIKRLKDATRMKLLVKGIQTREDAELAVAHGADGIVVSNHGGRAGASGRSTIESLPEIAAGVAGRIPIILDSGVRRGTDIFKALALGATAVGIGRPYVWGLAAFGQEGVEAVLDLLRRELQMVMRQTGSTSISKITGASVVDRFGTIPSLTPSHSSGNR
ncbi:MAG: alpha-hydroxy-acid oxidizing protein [Acidobacteria bacterium]|nr:alpha-hydroxy-acid oxidizing protein [Acidobacteriota bacterium]